MKTIFILFFVLCCVLSSAGQEEAIVKAQKANVRDFPSTAYGEVVFQVTKGAKLQLLSPDNKDGWYPVLESRTRKRGWIHGNSIEFVVEDGESQSVPEITKIYVTKTETTIIKPCKQPIYQPLEKDSGYDRAVYKGKSYVYINQVGNDVKILDTNTSEIIKADCSETQIHFTQKQKSETDNFVRTCSGNSWESPEVIIENGTDRTLTLYVGETRYEFAPFSTRKVLINSGTYYYVATAPRVIPLTGNKSWEAGCSYSWKFWIGGN